MDLLFTMPITKYVKQEQRRKVGAVKKASGIQDTLTINEALKDNGNDAKKVCENFGSVLRVSIYIVILLLNYNVELQEHKSARLNYALRSQASIEAHEENMQAIQKKLTGSLREQGTTPPMASAIQRMP
ncbi:hypothetical protein B9Z55_028769 [Caenorhabditis nigoni]|nr:hypothetical protein B9Z55_028769 [Caenorhabditis nigoni]